MGCGEDWAPLTPEAHYLPIVSSLKAGGESLNGHPLSALFLGIRRGPPFGEVLPPLPSSYNIDQGKACTTVPVGEGGDLLCSFGGAFSFFKWVPLFLS